MSLDFDSKSFQRILENDSHEYRAALQEFLSRPLFQPRYDLHTEAYRELTLKRCAEVLSNGWISLMDLSQNPHKWFAFHETTMLCDPSMSIKMGVHLTLYGASILGAGTEQQLKKHLRNIDTLSAMGCFCMTEMGHGSNVRGIETEAVWDNQQKCFILNSPNVLSQKAWIGGLADHATNTVVFAQLKVDDVNHGVHIFHVGLRDSYGKPLPGVHIRDNGQKMGMDGIDNGRAMFDHIKLPRDSLLSRFAKISSSGTYSSPIKSPSKRFAVMVSPLVGGRVSVSQSAITTSKMVLTIATRYAFQRRQFKDPNNPQGGETFIGDYITHQKRLYPLIAANVLMQFSVNQLKDIAARFTKNFDPTLVKSVHFIASALKPLTTWTRVETCQVARECTGAQGFMLRNRIGEYLRSQNIDVTWEGDNIVLLQQVGKILLTMLAKGQIKLDKSTLTPPQYFSSSPSYFSHLFKYRRDVQLATLGAKIQKYSRKVRTRSPQGAQLAAFSHYLNQVTKLALAHAEYLVVSIAAENIQKLQNDSDRGRRSTASLFSKFLELHACTRIESDLGWFLLHRAFSPKVGKSLIGSIDSCLRELHKDRLMLKVVNSWGIAESLINAPIAQKNYADSHDFDTGIVGTEISPVNTRNNIKL